MIGRKLAPVRSGHIIATDDIHPFVPDLQKMRRFGYYRIKKYEHLTLVALLRSYVRFSNFMKHEYEDMKLTALDFWKYRIAKKRGDDTVDTPSKFLQMISDYKRKVSHIKHRIHEEESRK
ncbi:hypothetical protein K2P96_02510 [Patescibacteria group bacterium]|nr:hypothetical protein [Patescibacteria group bacterium]